MAQKQLNNLSTAAYAELAQCLDEVERDMVAPVEVASGEPDDCSEGDVGSLDDWVIIDSVECDDRYVEEESRSSITGEPMDISKDEDVSEGGYEQLGGGIEPYELEAFQRQRARRFRLTANNYRLKFNRDWLDAQNPGDLPRVLREMFDRILGDLRQHVNGQDEDRVGIAIRHPSLDSPLRIAFCRFRDLRGEDIVGLIEKCHQSNVDIGVDETMTLEFLHVEDPARLGEGWGHREKKGPLTVKTFIDGKRSVIGIRNKDDLCFARALAVAKHYSARPEPFDQTLGPCRQWRSKYTALTREFVKVDHQRDAAVALLREAGIPLGPCSGRETWEAFARYLSPSYQLKIYSADIFNRLMFKSQVVNPSKILRLYHHDDHYDVITGMKAFTGYSRYCDDCDVGYNDVEKHKCSRKFRCYQCKRPGYCGPVADKGEVCLTCNRWFPNVRCYQRHAEPLRNKYGQLLSCCDTYERCKVCLEECHKFWEHICSNNRECKICKQSLSRDHRCYVQPIIDEKLMQELMEELGEVVEGYKVRDIDQERRDQRFVFYDFECVQDTGVHVPNLVVVHLGCGDCISNNCDVLCPNCPWRTEGEGPSGVKIFKGASTLEDFGAWLLRVAETKKEKKSNKRKRRQDSVDSDEDGAGTDDEGEGGNTATEEEILCLAHNYKGYDGHFLLQYFHKHLVKAPKIVLRGQQILQMKIGRLTFKDSLNFLTMPLKNFPKAFGLTELKKGFFPHFFNTHDNATYVGPYPPKDCYGADSMSTADREAFVKWHDEKLEERAVFDMAREILAYCRSDVDILRRGCAAFRELFIDQNNISPFKDAMTLPMACMLVYRKNYLPENTIAIIPPMGYRPQRRYSIQSLQWMRWLMHQDPSLRIQHARNGGEKRFTCTNDKTYSVDGYDGKTKTAYEYLGCFWHGCAKCYKTSRGKPHPTMGITMAETLHQTHYRLALLRKHPDVEKVVTIWECDFKRQMRDNGALATFVATFECLPQPLEPRDAFFGGRTNATKLYYEAGENEEIKYVDVCSLYPYINKYGKYPVGHPTILDNPSLSKLFELHGLIKCRILPPRQLYHPLLPYRACGKLMFPLCRLCAETQLDEDCGHTDAERAWIGTYTTLEVQEAVRECGYTVLKIFEAWHFEVFSQYNRDTRQGGLFADYVDNFFKLKQEASGPPDDCDDIQTYVAGIYRKEGVRLDVDNIVKNPGLRALAKYCLNNLWGKMGQRVDFTKSIYVTDPAALMDMLLNDRIEVHSVLVVNDDLLYASYVPEKEYQTPHPASNVVVAAWVTSQARLKLYSYIRPLDRRVLYFDTDSVIYVHCPDEWNPLLGDCLGELTDELDGNTITTFVSGGPKNYAFSLKNPRKDGTKTTCKVRGFTLNYRASKLLNMDTMRDLIRDGGDAFINVEYPKQITRGGLAKNNEIVSKDTTKKYRRVYTKRRLLFAEAGIPAETLPYGWTA